VWDVAGLYDTGEVTLLGTLAGNTNADGAVDIDDLNNVRNNFGAVFTLPVPEPASAALALLAATWLLACRNEARKRR